MKLLVRINLFVILLLFLPFVALAQQGQQRNFPKPDVYAENMVGQLSSKMELSDQQKELLTEVFNSFMSSQQDAMMNRDREKMMALREKRDKDAEKIIEDKNKIKTYRKFIEDQQSQVGRGQRGNG
jgi:hypothetical protein